MKTEVIYKNAVLVVTQLKSSEPESRADLVVTEEGETTNKSIIELSLKGRERSVIAVYWSHFSDDASLCVHFTEEEKILFVGGGGVSAVIDAVKLRLIDINYPMLFWSWECIRGHVLELGEIECRLYTTGGKLVGEAPVDPPYEYKARNHLIEFSSIIAGKTSIDFSYTQ